MQAASARLEKLSAQTFDEKRRKHKMKTNKSRKRLCSALLCLILTVSMLPITGYAGEGEIEATGGSAVQYPIEINETNFPDAAFRNYVKAAYFNANKDEILSASEISNAISIDFQGKYNISSLGGLEFFTNLSNLQCHNNGLTTLDLSKNLLLTQVGCTGNQVSAIDLTANAKLEGFHCSGNKLTSLDVSQNTKLVELTCYDNELRTLTFGKNTALKTLKCSGNELNALDLTALTALTTLECYDNELESLNINGLTKLTEVNCSNRRHQGMLSDLVLGNNGALKSLDCSNNSLTSLELSKLTGLTQLTCGDNDMKSLDVSVLANLKTLDCSAYSFGRDKGSLTSLVFGDTNTNLTNVGCRNNQLTSLNVSRLSKLTSLDCSNNQLTSLDVSGLANLNWLSCDGNEYTIQVGRDGKFDLSNLPTGFDVNRVTQWTNASVKQEDGRNMLKVDDNASEVTYTYNCSGETNGNPKFTATFTLLVEKEQTYAINVENDGNGTASASVASAAQGEAVTLTAAPNEGYEFKEWQVVSGNITINDNKFTMPASEVTIKASFKKKAASGGSSGGGAYVPSTPPAPSNPKPSGSAVTSDVSGSTSRKDGETSTKVDQSTADKLVDAAIDNKSTDIVIDTASKTENGGCQTSKLLRSRCRRRRSRTSPKRPMRASPSRRMSARSSWITRRRRPFPSRGKRPVRRASRKPSVSSPKKSKRIPRKCAMSCRSRTPAARRSLTSGAAQPRSLCRFQAVCREKGSSASISTKKGIITK